MKRFLLILLALLLTSCATANMAQLERRLAEVEEQLQVLQASGVGATDRIWPFYGLTGGGNALDGITETSIGTNDLAMGRDSSGYWYSYYWDATYAGTCTSPSCVDPSPSDGTGSWRIIPRTYAGEFYSTAADGDHYLDPSNTSAFPTGVAEGSVTCRDDRDACFVYDGTYWLPMFAGNYADCTTTGMDCDDASPDTATIPSAYAWGGVVTNDGAIGNVTMTLPAAVKRMMIRISRVDASGSITIEENAVASDVIDGAANIVLDADRESVTLFAISNDTWAIVGDSGTNTNPTYN